MKHRINKIKREHGIIEGGLKVLTNLARDPDIISIIPGPIKNSKTNTRLEIYFQYKTATGYKYLLKGNGVVQEVFIIKKALQKHI